MSSSVPPIFSESFQRRNGLIIFAGLQDSGTEEAVNAAFKDGKQRPLVFWESAGAPDRKTDSNAVIVVRPEAAPDLEAVLSAAESGRLVVWLMSAPGPLTALRKILSKSFGEGRSHLLWRLSDLLILVAGQMRLPAIAAAEFVDAYEILLMTPALKEALAKEDFEEMDQSLRSADDESGVVSFNQSLLQLLLRRSIDIKTAFEATRDPVNLDQILKKVGI